MRAADEVIALSVCKPDLFASLPLNPFCRNWFLVGVKKWVLRVRLAGNLVKGDYMKFLGWVYIVFGTLAMLVGFASVTTDIQVILGFVGMAVAGIGVLMLKK